MPGESTSMKFFGAMPLRILSCVRWMRPGPNLRRPSKPRSGSPTSAGPSWSASLAPGAMTVKLSSVGATPAVCTSRPSAKFAKLDLPLEWLPSSSTKGSTVGW